MPRPIMRYLAGAAFALTAASAFAQVAPPAPPVPPPTAFDHDHADRDRAHAERDRARAERDHERAEQRVIVREERHHMDQAEHLRTMLQLKPDQEAALTAYLAAVKPAHHIETVVEMSSHGEASKTTPQRLAEMETRLAEQSAQGKARIEATRKFYDQLEPSQKKVFDEMPMMMIGPMGPMMNMGNMRVMVNMEGVPPLPPLPPVPPAPPRL
jgi:LTXXQ motif family protein